MNTPTDWFSAIAILAGGLILGVLFVYFFNRRRTAKIETDLERKDLEFKRDALIQQLRDLDENAGAEERARLEKETADVLRKLDQRAPVATPAIVPVAETPSYAMNPALKGFLWGAGSFAALAALGYLVMQQATPREQNGSPTGGPMAQQQQAAQQQAPDPAVLQLEAAVQKDPANLQLRNDLAQAYLERDNLMGVFEQTKVVLEKQPDDSRALTFQGLVRMAMGDANAATAMLVHATKSDPKNLDSWVGLAWVYSQTGKMDDAKKAIDAAALQSPPDKPRLEQVWAQMQQHEAAPAPAVSESQMASGELPPGHPPIDGQGQPMAAAPVAASAAASGPAVQVTLDLDPGASSKTGILYVMARNPMGGPPIAVKRLQPTSFPLTITLSQADSMMGQPLPASFRLEARLDSDGDAATKPPTDPHAMQDNVAPGAVVKLALK